MIAVRVTTARQLMHRKPEGRSNRSGTRPPQKLRTSQDLEGSGDIKGGIDICGENWSSISSSLAMSSRIWNLLCPLNDATGDKSLHPLHTVEDCAERNDPVPSERTAV